MQPSSETQGQIVGPRESLNGRKNKARRKVKNGEKSPWGQWARSIQPKFQPVRPGKEDHLKRWTRFSKLFLDRTDPLSFGPKFPECLVEWNAPNVLPDQFQTVAAVLASDWCQKTCVFLHNYLSYSGTAQFYT